MTFTRGALAVLIRVATMTAFYVVYTAVLYRSESTDALGAGLLFFLIAVVVTLAWAGLDGARHGFVVTGVVWLGASLLISAALGVVDVVTLSRADDDSLAFAYDASDFVFFALLWFVPAVVGAAVGGVIHRSRPAASVDRPTD